MAGKGNVTKQGEGTTGRSREVDDFLQKVRSMPAQGSGQAAGQRGRLIFSLDATASRQPTWDQAMDLQAEMFSQSGSLGGLDVQLAFYRGFGECKASRWHSEPGGLLKAMTAVQCLAGRTQIARLLRHARSENAKKKVSALVFIGDCVEEDVDELGHLAGELKLIGVPCFLFQEGQDPTATQAFAQIAKLSGGAHCRFDAGSARQLKDLLGAVAVYASGGMKALSDRSREQGGAARQLHDRLRLADHRRES
ncbi:MAG: VWA domain-containing protein [Pseudomonadota bacterium]